MKNIHNILFAFAISVFSLLGSGCVQWDTVEPGQVGVVVNYGKLDPHAYKPGFYFYSFLANDMQFMSTRMQTYTFGNRRDQQNQAADQANTNVDSYTGPAIQILSNDQLQVSIDITIQYHLNGTFAPAVYREFSMDYAEALVEVPVRSAVRNAASEFVARDLVVHREQLQASMERKIAEQIAYTLHSKGVSEMAIIVDNVSLRQIDLPDSLENSIRQVQEQQMLTLQRQQAIETARQEAERLRIEAEGATAAQLIRAEGTANANRAVAASLSPQILRLRELEAQYAMVANSNSRLVVVPYGQPTVVNVPNPNPAVTAATNQR